MWCTCTASVVILPCARHQRHRPPSRRRTSARVRCHLAVLRMRAAASALGALAGRCGHSWPRWWTPPHHLQDTSTPPPPPENKKGQPARTWAACPALSLLYRIKMLHSLKFAQKSPGEKSAGAAGYCWASRCIRSAHACKMYPCTLWPASAAACRISAPVSLSGLIMMLSREALYLVLALVCAAVTAIPSTSRTIITCPAVTVNVHFYYKITVNVV